MPNVKPYPRFLFLAYILERVAFTNFVTLQDQPHINVPPNNYNFCLSFKDHQ